MLNGLRRSARLPEIRRDLTGKRALSALRDAYLLDENNQAPLFRRRSARFMSTLKAVNKLGEFIASDRFRDIQKDVESGRRRAR